MEVNNLIIGNRIKGLLSIKDISREELSKKMGISYNTLTKKLNGKREFGTNDLIKMKKIFNLDAIDCGNIFFNPEFLIEKQN